MTRVGVFCAEYHSPYKPYFRRQAQAFTRVMPTVYTWEQGPEVVEGIPVVGIDAPWSRATDSSFLRRATARLGCVTSSSTSAETELIERLLHEYEIDVVIAHSGFVADRVADACGRVGIPFIAHLHGIDLHGGRRVKGLGKRLANVCNAAARTLVVGGYMVDWLVQLGVDRSSIIVSPMGAPVHDRAPAEGAGPDNHFLFVGRLVEYKSLGTVIDAIALANRQGGTVRLSIVGDGPMRANWEAHAARVGQADTIEFLGVRSTEDVDSLLDTRSGLVIHAIDHPGGPEAFGVVVTEAMAAGRPVIVSRCGGLVDQIRDGHEGFVVEQRDVAGLSAALLTLGGDVALRSRLGANARARAETHFDSADLARGVEDVVLAVVGPSAP
jgi:glycosyltransferase involved in cell wall biosynthesis